MKKAPPGFEMTDFFKTVELNCQNATNRVGWHVQKAVLERGDPVDGCPAFGTDFNYEKYHLPPLDERQAAKLGIFNISEPKLMDTCKTRKQMEHYLVDRVDLNIHAMAKRGAGGKKEILAFGGKVAVNGWWPEHETAAMANMHKMLEAFWHLDQGQTKVLDPGSVSRVTALLDYGAFNNTLKKDPSWKQQYAKFISTQDGGSEIEPLAGRMEAVFSRCLEGNDTGGIDETWWTVLPTSYLTEYATDGTDLRKQARLCNMNDVLKKVDQTILESTLKLKGVLVDKAPPLPWTEVQGKIEAKKREALEKFLTESVCPALLHDEESLDKVTEVTKDVQYWGGIITQRMKVTEMFTNIVVASEEPVGGWANIKTDIFQEPAKVVAQLGEYRYETKEYQAEAAQVAGKLAAAQSGIVDVGVVGKDSLVKAVISAGTIMSKLSDMVPAAAPLNQETHAHSLRKYKQDSLKRTFLVNTEQLVGHITDASKDGADPKDYIAAATKLRKQLEEQAGVDYMKECQASYETATKELNTYKSILLRNLAGPYGDKCEASEKATPPANWQDSLSEQEKVKIDLDAMKTKAKPYMGKPYLTLKAAMTELSTYGKTFEKHKTDWKFSHPVVARAAKCTKAANLLISELGMLMQFEKTGQKLKDGLKTEGALLGTRGLLEKDVFPPLMVEVRKHR
jgi:hypothetical protein